MLPHRVENLAIGRNCCQRHKYFRRERSLGYMAKDRRVPQWTGLNKYGRFSLREA